MGEISLQNLGFLKFFWVRNPCIWTDSPEVRHGVGDCCFPVVPNLETIGGTCRPCGAINRKIAPRVIVILAFLPVTGRYNTAKLYYSYSKLNCVIDIYSR